MDFDVNWGEQWFKSILIALLIFCVLIIFYFAFNYYGENGDQNISTEDTYLQHILKTEISLVNLTNDTCRDGYCKCLDYANYYNITLHEKYPELDIRWLREIDVCNNQTLCDQYHTYLLVNGWGEECILDQHRYACVQLEMSYESNRFEIKN